jgi:hypothetical protein
VDVLRRSDETYFVTESAGVLAASGGLPSYFCTGDVIEMIWHKKNRTGHACAPQIRLVRHNDWRVRGKIGVADPLARRCPPKSAAVSGFENVGMSVVRLNERTTIPNKINVLL